MFIFLRLMLAAIISAAALGAHGATAAAKVGQKVTLSLTVSGTAPFKYKWLKNGVALTGATAATYVISSFQAGNAGNYTATISNSAGSITSDAATLTLATAPVITAQPVSKTASVGGSVTFSVTATGSPAPTYQWRKNGTTITGATGSSYSIATVASTQGGSYSVVVKNSVGTVTSGNAVLTISNGPVITAQPVGQTVIAGASVTFAVTATGSPAPTYQWRKNGTTITGATSSTYSIASVTSAHAGTYTVVVKNTGGSVSSGNAVLTVNPALPRHADFNGDGKSDIFWQNILTGEHRVWLMAGTTLSSTVPMGTMDTDWEVIGVSDFNGDRKNDIMWQNLVTRESAVWYMAGTTMAGGASLGVASSGMLMVGVGDFNADGRPDILWKNVSTNAYSIRFMNGITPGTSVVIGTGPTGWTVGGTGDFNGDGKTDILWQKVSDGSARVWAMNGSAYASATDLGARGAGWVLGGTGDFNGDGKTDILWQHSTTGARRIVLMSGLIKTNEISLTTTPVEWIMVN